MDMTSLRIVQKLREASKRCKEVQDSPNWYRSCRAWKQLYSAWNQCILVSEQIFRVVGPKTAILICLQMVEDALPLFERTEGRLISSIRKALARVKRKIEDWHFPIKMYSPPSRTTPGTNNLTSAVMNLFFAIESIENVSTKWVEYCSSVVADVIIACSLYVWGTDYPKLWKQYYEIVLMRKKKIDPHKELELIIKRIKYPKSIEIEYSKWQEFADKCERYLQLR